MNRVHIICFAVCYLIALGADILRRRENLTDGSVSETDPDSPTRTIFSRWSLFLITVGFTLSGLLAQTLYLNRFLDWSTGLTPLSTLKGCLFSVSWFLAVVYLSSLRCRKQTIFPVLLLLTALAFIGVGAALGNSPGFARQPVYVAWGIVHGVSQMVFFTSLMIGVIVGCLYLIQARRLKRRRGMNGIRLPSLEWLARANRRSLVCSVVALVPGIFSGIVLLQLRQNPADWKDFIFDPTILGSSIIFLWLIWTLIRGRIYQPFSEGTATARRTIFLFAVLILTMLAAFFAPRGHLRGSSSLFPTAERVILKEKLEEKKGKVKEGERTEARDRSAIVLPLNRSADRSANQQEASK